MPAPSKAIIAQGQTTIIDLNDPISSSTEPIKKVLDMLWLDTSVPPAVLKRWNGIAWEKPNDNSDKIEDVIETVTTLTTDFKVEKGKITTLISDVTQTKKDITTTQNGLTSVTGSVSTLQSNYSSLNQTVSGLSTTVGTHTSSITTATNTANNALNSINGLQIGGRNIARLSGIQGVSKTIVGKQGYVSTGMFYLSGYDELGGGVILDKARIYEPATQYVMRFKIIINHGNLYYLYFTNGQKMINISIYIDKIKQSSGYDSQIPINLLDSKYHEVIVYFTTPTTLLDFNIGNNQTILQPDKFSDANAYDVDIADFKIEKGTKPTDWSPPPEDVDALITSVIDKQTQFDIAIGSITGRVSSVETTTSTMAGTVAETKSAVSSMQLDLNGFKTSVSNTYATQSALTGLTTRVTTAEQKITSSAIVSTVTSSSSWTGLPASIQEKILGNGTPLPSTADLNTYKTPGVWTTSNLGTVSNIPTGVQANGEVRLIVETMGSSTYLQQTLVASYAGTLKGAWRRTGSSSSWKPWAQMADTSNMVSCINQTAESIKIQASKILLEGIVTANSKFKILADGSMEAVNGKFSGNITSTSGTIGGFNINDTSISKNQTIYYDYVKADYDRAKEIILGNVTPTSADISRLDINGDGKITSLDYVLIKNLVDLYGNALSSTISMSNDIKNGCFYVRNNTTSADILKVGITGVSVYSLNSSNSVSADSITTNSLTSSSGVKTSNSSIYSNGFIELYHATPYIDFHYGGNSSDFTSRIGEYTWGVLTANAGWVCQSLAVQGPKQRVVQTANYNVRGLNAIESPDCLFQDYGGGKTNEEGYCIIFIDPIFRETISSNIKYRVTLTPCSNNVVYCKTDERYADYFIVRSEPNVEFDWSITAIQRDYENDRILRSFTEIHEPEENAAERMDRKIYEEFKKQEDYYKNSNVEY